MARVVDLWWPRKRLTKASLNWCFVAAWHYGRSDSTEFSLFGWYNNNGKSLPVYEHTA
jgi:hypothetical protein